MDGVHGVEPGRADLDETALTLEDGALAARLAGDDDACVTVVKSQAVVVLRHEQRPADVPGVLGEAVHLVGEPVLYDGVPGGDAVRAAAVGAEEAERAERGHRGSGVSGAGRLDDAAAGRDGDLADG